MEERLNDSQYVISLALIALTSVVVHWLQQCTVQNRRYLNH